MRLYTLTPNPALDLSGHVKSLVANEKNYVFDERKDPGGNGINAARIAHRLGATSLALGFIGGSSGNELTRLLRKEGLTTAFTSIRGDTRTNVTVTNDADHKQTRLTFHGPRVSRAEVSRLVREVSRLRGPGYFVLGGSMPPGCPDSFHFEVGKAAARRGLEVVVDVPAKFIPGILGKGGFRPFLLKPNQVELEEWAGRKLESDAEILGAAREMATHCSLVCVSLAEKGALLVCEDGSAWRGIAPKIRARGTVGAGDSMVGAMIAHLVRRKLSGDRALANPGELAEMLRWGLAAGAATAEAKGTAQASKAEIRRLRPKVRVESLSAPC